MLGFFFFCVFCLFYFSLDHAVLTMFETDFLCLIQIIKTKLSTKRTIIQLYCYFNMTEVELSLWDFILHISDDLISMWQAVNPRLPLIFITAIRRKVKDLLNLVKDINRKQ